MDIWVYGYVLGTAMAVELVVYLLPFVWRHTNLRKAFASILAVAVAFASGGLIVSGDLILALAGLVGIYRSINLLRLTEGRMNKHYLKGACTRTGIVLILVQAMLLLIALFVPYGNFSWEVLILLISVLSFMSGLILLITTHRRLKHTEFKNQSVNVSSYDLPTVTVAVPARNETHELEQCLKSIIASDYPKLEILVLDDCSQTRRTPEIIRSFAHDGVRFVKGDMPKQNWLAKNQAYEKLSSEASGDILLFCGVDVRFESHSIRELVTELMVRKKRMLSVVPLRGALENQPQYSLSQAARYFWELAPPRRLFNRPPVLSSCWLIYKKELKNFGGFAAVSRMIMPEAYFAKRALVTDGYSFLRSDGKLGLTSQKTVAAQRHTAIRTRYPQLHRRPENVLFFSFAGTVLFISPFLIALMGLTGNAPLLTAALSVLAVSCLSATHVIIVTRTRVIKKPMAFISFLPATVVDVALMHISMYKYEFSDVIWKGRNVCIPVMHVIPSLPPIEPEPSRDTI